MNPPSLIILLTHFEWNIQRLQETLQNEKSDYFRDAALQRFGHAFDMAVKCIDAAAALEKKQLDSPRQGFLWAVDSQWLQATAPIEDMFADHAALPKKQDNATPEAVFAKIDRYLLLFKELYANLTQLVV